MTSDFYLVKVLLPNEDTVECPHCAAYLEVTDNRWADEKPDWTVETANCPACGKKFTLTVQYIMHVSAKSYERQEY